MDIPKHLKKNFTTRLTDWHRADNDRALPWKNEHDPYKIWLSEILLQQTRAQQALPYYLSFIKHYPTVEVLAAADDEEVFRLWQGLGYYNRCRNMLATARMVGGTLGGRFPQSYEGLLGLKGIGPYTAAAIGSFAFGLPTAVVDGNVYRVLSRCFGIFESPDTPAGKQEFTKLAGELLDVQNSASYNQAIMDLGATVCTPARPRCAECPLAKQCFALRQEAIGALPVRNKKVRIRKRYFHYFILEWENTIWMHQRADKDIWQHLYEPFLIEKDHPMDMNEIMNTDALKFIKSKNKNIEYRGMISQKLTHQVIESHFYWIRLLKKAKIDHINGCWLSAEDLEKAAKPKTLVSFLKNNLYF